jgi:thioesterase domain-containing protein
MVGFVEATLGGFCDGATVAFEVAQQLRHAGEEVALLAVVDQELVSTESQRLSWSAFVRMFLRNLPNWIREGLLPSGPTAIVKRLGSRGRLMCGAIARRWAPRMSPCTPDVRDELDMWRYPDSFVEHIQKVVAAVQSYRGAAYDGPILLIRPQTQPLLRPEPRVGRGWEGIALGEFSVEIVPGSHSTILSEPFVTSLADTLRKHLQARLAGHCLFDHSQVTDRAPALLKEHSSHA